MATKDHARAMLAEIYVWFTDGLHIAAKALLEELGG
jgi:hypothetical protein